MTQTTPLPTHAQDIANSLSSDGPVLRTLLIAFPDAIAVYAFGSRVNGTPNSTSDLDLAVLVPGYADPLQLWDTSSQIASLLQCPVDLLDFRAASTVMQHQVLITGRRLWDCGLPAGLFECFVLSEMHSLNAARAGLLADIEKKGTIYGR